MKARSRLTAGFLLSVRPRCPQFNSPTSVFLKAKRPVAFRIEKLCVHGRLALRLPPAVSKHPFPVAGSSMRTILKRVLVAVLLTGGAFLGGLAGTAFLPQLEPAAVAQLQGTGGSPASGSEAL